MYIHVHCRYIIIIIQVHWTFSTVDTVHISSECTLSKDNYCYMCTLYMVSVYNSKSYCGRHSTNQIPLPHVRWCINCNLNIKAYKAKNNASPLHLATRNLINEKTWTIKFRKHESIPNICLKYLSGCYGVDKAGLLESCRTYGDGHFPARVHDLVHHLLWEVLLVFAGGNSLEEQVHIVTERLDLHSGKEGT